MPVDNRADELYRACDSRPTDPEMEEFQSYSTHNRYAYGGSATAGCFYCCEMWEPAGMEVADFCDCDDEAPDEIGNATIMCPFCGIDSVICSIDVHPVTYELLTALNEYWF